MSCSLCTTCARLAGHPWHQSPPVDRGRMLNDAAYPCFQSILQDPDAGKACLFSCCHGFPGNSDSIHVQCIECTHHLTTQSAPPLLSSQLREYSERRQQAQLVCPALDLSSFPRTPATPALMQRSQQCAILSSSSSTGS